jgi:DNA-binding NarL/FixJ family response regulator
VRTVARPDGFAAVTTFLGSGQAKFVTGLARPIDGRACLGLPWAPQPSGPPRSCREPGCQQADRGRTTDAAGRKEGRVLSNAEMRLVIADDSALLREGLGRLLDEAGIEVVGRTGDWREAIRLAGERKPDAVMLDIRMPPSYTDEGLRVAREVRRRSPGVGLLVLSQHIDVRSVVELLSEHAGGLGYLVKNRVSDPTELVDALRRVVAGGFVVDAAVAARLVEERRRTNELDALTERERDVLRLMSQGRSNQAIASRLFMNQRTVEAHIRRVFTKLKLAPSGDDHRRVLAVLRYLRSSVGSEDT